MSSAAAECAAQAPADDVAVIAPETEAEVTRSSPLIPKVEVTRSSPLIPNLPPNLPDGASRKVIDPEAIAAYAAASAAAAALAAAGANVAAAAASNAAFVALADDDNAVHLPGFWTTLVPRSPTSTAGSVQAPRDAHRPVVAESSGGRRCEALAVPRAAVVAVSCSSGFCFPVALHI